MKHNEIHKYKVYYVQGTYENEVRKLTNINIRDGNFKGNEYTVDYEIDEHWVDLGFCKLSAYLMHSKRHHNLDFRVLMNEIFKT